MFADEFEILKVKDLPPPELDCRISFNSDELANREYIINKSQDWASELITDNRNIPK